MTTHFQSPTAAPASQLRNGGRILVDQLRLHGVDTAWCVPGESYLEVLDAFCDVGDEINLITCRHEQGAANMAEAYGKLTGKPGICFVTRGPGACNASIGIHTARQDSTPLILFIGQVARDQFEREAFQEIDYRQMFGPMAKWVAQIENAERIPEFVARAFRVATSGRPGPVVLALPEDMLRDHVKIADGRPYAVVQANPARNDLERLAVSLSQAKKPMAVIGGGGWTPKACADISAFLAAWDIPVCSTFRRQDIVDNRVDVFVGELGYTLSPKLAKRMAEADTLLLIGTRFGEVPSQGYEVPNPACLTQTVLHIHAEPEEIGRVWAPTVGIVSGMVEFAAAIGKIPVAKGDWAAWRQAARADYLGFIDPDGAVVPEGSLDMRVVVRDLRDLMPDDAIMTIDAGNFSGWVHRFLPFKTPRTQLAPTCGAMGYSIPAAVGASLVHRDRMVVGFVGDGGFMMTQHEIATAVQYGGRPIIIVVNNGMYGTIRMHQEKRHPGRVSATELKNPDFVALARSFGAHGELVTDETQFRGAFERSRDSGVAAVIEIRLPQEAISTATTLSKLRESAFAAQKSGQ
ncbi:MAG: thiamine pyrophosphate-binding protein [Pseudomonadota bacterium]